MALKINLATVTNSFEAFDAEAVSVKVSKNELYKSKSDKQMLRVIFTVVSDDTELSGKMVTENYNLEGTNLSWLKNFLVAVGYDPDEEIDIEDLIENQSLIGRELTVDIVAKNQKQIDPATNKPYPPKSTVTRYYTPTEL